MSLPIPPIVVPVNIPDIDTEPMGKFGEKLVDVIAKGAGILYEPIRIREKAKAEADAAVIAAEAQVKVDDIAARAQHRQHWQALNRQRNMEAIFGHTFRLRPDEVSDKPVDPDWGAQFVNLSQDISNEDMQFLWARLLAGEVSKPGSYSLRTLDTLRLMSQSDAALFQEFAGFVWTIGGGAMALTTDDGRGIVWNNRTDVDYTELMQLDAAGLIHLKAVGITESGETITIAYGAKRYVAKIASRSIVSPVRGFALTEAGNKLLALCDERLHEDYLQWWLQTWQTIYGITVTTAG